MMFYQCHDIFKMCDGLNMPIYKDPQYISQQTENEQQQQQQQQQHQAEQLHDYNDDNDDDVEDFEQHNLHILNSQESGVLFGVRKRHLSCIEEVDSDSLHSSSLHAPYEMIRDVDERFKQLVQNMSNNSVEETNSDDQIVMIDESRLYELDYLNNISESQMRRYDEDNEVDVMQDMWQSTFSEPARVLDYAACTDIMATSCYGALGSSHVDETMNSYSKPNQTKDTEHLYATPKKIRELNYSFNSPCQSEASSVYGGLESIYSSPMTTSLDLKCMSDSIDLSNNYTMELNAQDLPRKSDISRNLVEEFDVVAEKCFFGAENDLQSIRRILDNSSSNAVCPCCRISFDKGKRRKLIDTCGHERCYSCMFRNDQCPMCKQNSFKDTECNNAQGYDTGIGGSTSTIVSPLASPQPQLRSQIQRAHDGSICRKFITTNSSSSISLATSAAGSVQLETVTADVHMNGNSALKQQKQKLADRGTSSSSKVNSTVYATPPTRRRFFINKNLRSALTGHRRTASNGGGGLIDTATLLSTGGDNPIINPTLDVDGMDKEKDQLRMRLGLLLNPEQNDSSVNAMTTSSGGSSHNISPEQTLGNDYRSRFLLGNSYGSMKDDLISLSNKFKASCALNDNTKIQRKVGLRRSPRVYKSATTVLSSNVQLPLKPLFFEVPLQEADPPFVGRQWLLRELSYLLTATDTSGVLITGQSGTGKTALMLQLVEYSCFGRRNKSQPQSELEANDGIYCQINVSQDRLRSLASLIVGYHFCQADVNFSCLVPDFVHSLAAQLCQAPQLAAYRDYLLSEPHLQDILSVKECIANAERVMRVAVLEPLCLLERQGKIPAKNCIILIDALCEAEYHRPDHGHTIASFLAQMMPHFPAWLKVVATMRAQLLDLVQTFHYKQLSLDLQQQQHQDLLQKDMLDFITFRLEHSARIQQNIAGVSQHMKFVSYLQTLSQGSMLFAKMTLDLIERGQLVIKSSSYKVLPVSLAQIFLLHFNLRFPSTNSFNKAAAILQVCLAALYPLTLQEIYYSICALHSDNSLSWTQFQQTFKLLDGFLIRRSDNTYMFFHACLREWLIRRDKDESTKFLCDARLGHAAIAMRLTRLQAPLGAEETLELGHHMLKAHIYRSQQPVVSRDLQSYWLASCVDNISATLGALRNVYSPNVKVSRLILLAGALPNYRTEFLGGATLLCIAAHEGITSMVNLLLEFGADVYLTNSQGSSPLILAAMRGHCDVVQLLVAAGSALGQTDTTQRCALVHAARLGQLSVLKYMLNCEWFMREQMQDVSRPVALQQALLAAAAQNHVPVLEELLKTDDVNINVLEPSSGELPLTFAAHHGCLDAVTLLLQRGANIELRNQHGDPALWLAVKEAHLLVAQHLLQNGAQIDVTVGTSKKTPLILAAEKGHIQLMKLLMQHGAQLELQDAEGLTALSWACLRGHLNVAKQLMEQGANRQHVDKNGRTVLDLAAYQGTAGLVQYLLENGVNIEHVDINGMRPLDRSIACRNMQAVQLLLRKGAKLGPNTWLMAMGKPEILVVLLNKLLEDGNLLYRKQRFNEAAHRYQYALRKISNLETLIEGNGVFAQLRTNLLLNLSRCKRKLNELDESIDLASQAIVQKPLSYEGYYARAKARMQQLDLLPALEDANEALQKALQSNETPDVIEVLKHIQAEVYSSLANKTSDKEEDSMTTSAEQSSTAKSEAAPEVTDL